MKFGPMVKHAREKTGMSLSQAAKLLGVSKGHLHNLESGNASNASRRVLRALSREFELRPDALLSAED